MLATCAMENKAVREATQRLTLAEKYAQDMEATPADLKHMLEVSMPGKRILGREGGEERREEKESSVVKTVIILPSGVSNLHLTRVTGASGCFKATMTPRRMRKGPNN